MTNQKLLLQNVDDEYEDILVKLSAMRLENMQCNLRKFDVEHEKWLDCIQQNSISKHGHESNQLHEKENQISQKENEEMIRYLDNKRQRELESIQKVEEAERHRLDLELKMKQLQEQKRERNMKKKILGQLSDTARSILSKVTELFQQCKDTSGIPQHFNALINQVTKEYSNCSSIINVGINDDSNDIDDSIQQVKDSLKRLEQLLKGCEEFSKAIIEKRLAEEEKKRKEEEEEKAKQEEKRKLEENKALPTVIVAPASVPTTTNNAPVNSTPTKIPPLSSALSITAAVPLLAPEESTLHSLLHLFSTKTAFMEYLRLQKLLLDTVKAIEPLDKSTLKEKKAYKFELYKVVNTTINAISDESPKHLLDKIMKLHALLSEQEIQMSGNKISTKSDEHALVSLFMKHLFTL